MAVSGQIFQAHLSQSGLAVNRRARLKEFAVVGTASAGQIDVFDSLTAPETGTYVQSGTTVTVTDTGHGLSTGDVVGIAFDAGTGGTSDPGNYEITVTNANVFTFTSLNSITITGTNACRYVSNSGSTQEKPNRWLMTKETGAGDTFQNVFQIPQDGFLVRNGCFFSMSNMATAEVFFE